MPEAVTGTDVSQITLIGDAGTDGDGATPLVSMFGAPLAEQVPVGLDDVACLPYSSGTTGVPKGVMLTHRNLVANIVQMLTSVDLGQGETLVAVLPFFHLYGQQVLMNNGIRAGATVVTMPRFDL